MSIKVKCVGMEIIQHEFNVVEKEVGSYEEGPTCRMKTFGL